MITAIQYGHAIWFSVIIDNRSKHAPGSILHVDTVEELITLDENTNFNIAEVFLVTPRRINRNATLQMNQICSVFKGTDPLFRKTVYAYAVEPAFKLLDAISGSVLDEIDDLEEICSFTYPYN
ncbi:hypothetical protein LCGC14_0950790 [marine sediment metagenome]|uniref:Uncharacterized protein n=1 Tax=marine sediment metagenome TaxID=412755 RepID=A0A0F9P3G5_9ZZZZ|nr:hypothetical protein [Methylophaga sp.]HEC60507.1 hypothetical protein [Methylophaga sp.]